MGSKRVARSMPAQERIRDRTSFSLATIFTGFRGVSAQAANPLTPLTTLPEPTRVAPAVETLALGVDDTLHDHLSEDQFPAWSTHRRCQLTSDGAGRVPTSERAEFLRCEIASSYDSLSA